MSALMLVLMPEHRLIWPIREICSPDAYAPRANWKGFIKFGEVSCPVALYTAASSSERIAFNTLNRKTGKFSIS
jgi:hypothetical protein